MPGISARLALVLAGAVVVRPARPVPSAVAARHRAPPLITCKARAGCPKNGRPHLMAMIGYRASALAMAARAPQSAARA